MSIVQKNLFWTFLLSFSLTMAAPIYYPALRLFYFVPFLIIVYYKKPFLTALWAALLCGLIVDLLSAKTHLGLFALNYILTTCAIYPLRKHFFGDSLSTLPLMTFFFSVLSSLLQGFIMYYFESSFILSWRWIFVDLILLPLCDAIFAFVCFILPWRLFGKQPRPSSEYFT